MTYYEELGISQSAETEEIRQAHRRVARLFHPDQIQNEDLRRMAELQMKRLNELCAVLCDPHRRLQYDLSLAARKLDHRSAPPKSAVTGFLSREPVWIAGALACVLLVSWLLTGFGGASRESRSSDPSALRAADTSPVGILPAGAAAQEAGSSKVLEEINDLRRENLDLRREVDFRIQQRDSAVTELDQLRDKLEQAQSAPASQPTVTEIVAPAAIPAPSVAEVPPLPGAVKHPLAGTWFYLRNKSADAPADLYPPEYIEAAIQNSNGTVRGRYRGVYRVTDLPISPEVVFQFGGEENDQNSYPWSGPGGASGEVWLELESDGALRVSWLANQLGSQMGLASGSAVLVRQR